MVSAGLLSNDVCPVQRIRKMGCVPLLSDDDKFIECAVALKAEAIITGDKALRAIEEYMGITIVNPDQFFKRFPIH